jgi:hypothetical protein
MTSSDPRVLTVAAALVALFDAIARERCAMAPDELLGLTAAASVAATSVRVLRAAIHAGDLVAYGGQRDRSVRRGELARWIEERRVHIAGVDDEDLRRRMRRLRVVGDTRSRTASSAPKARVR